MVKLIDDLKVRERIEKREESGATSQREEI